MIKKQGKIYEELRAYLNELPVIDTHEHQIALCSNNQELDILSFLASCFYYPSDLYSASIDYAGKAGSTDIASKQDIVQFLRDSSNSFDDRYEVWLKFHKRTCYTAYAKALFDGMRECWGLADISKNSLLETQEKMRSSRNQDFYDKLLEKYNIKKMIVNIELLHILNGARFNRQVCLFVLDLPSYHEINNMSSIRKPQLQAILGRNIVTLDDYLEAFEKYLVKSIEFGIVGMKDQSAYTRRITYEYTDRGTAEKIFNKIISNPRDNFGTEEVRPLEDFLFHQFMHLADKYRLPVQIHTGHMAGLRNEIAKTNPANFTNALELHQNVKFDLFHGGWPFMGEFLFLGKNYPNVYLNMCWANAIDPLYSIEFFKRALFTVPHAKILGFGGDTGTLEMTIGYIELAKDNIAYALSDMIDMGWIDMDSAKSISADWLYNNPEDLFGLGGLL
ncbi:MAG TPA: amidohydrolase family protein [Clostridiales bacterium]|nr:amidohydrolase family protein [Clostridiales bacterium]